jgi:hypothetical protein
LGNLRRIAHLGRLLAPLLALAVLAAALPPLAVTDFPTRLAAAGGSSPAPSDQTGDRNTRFAISGAARSESAAGRQLNPHSPNQSSADGRAVSAAAALREMPDAATQRFDGRRWLASTQRNALAWTAVGVTVAPVRTLL